MQNRNNSCGLFGAARFFGTIAGFGIVAALATPALAEKGDREKPINITADRGSQDQRKQESIFEGNVLLIQGTLRVEANRIVVRQEKDGFDYATATGSPAKFRQKRDGLDEFIDGQSQRIEYDGKQEIVQFFDKARLTRGQDEITSNYIQYNSRTEVFQAAAQKEAISGTGGGRVTAVIQPKAKNPASEQNPAVPSKPSDSVQPQ